MSIRCHPTRSLPTPTQPLPNIHPTPTNPYPTLTQHPPDLNSSTEMSTLKLVRLVTGMHTVNILQYGTCRDMIGGWHVCTLYRWHSWYVHRCGWMVSTLKHPNPAHVTHKAPSKCHPKRHPNPHQRQPDRHLTPPNTAQTPTNVNPAATRPLPTSTDRHPAPKCPPSPGPVAPGMHHPWTCRHTIGGWHVCTEKRWPYWYFHRCGWMVSTLKHPNPAHVTHKVPSKCHPKPTKPNPTRWNVQRVCITLSKGDGHPKRPKGWKTALLAASPGFRLGHHDCTDCTGWLQPNSHRGCFTVNSLQPCRVGLDRIPSSV